MWAGADVPMGGVGGGTQQNQDGIVKISLQKLIFSPAGPLSGSYFCSDETNSHVRSCPWRGPCEREPKEAFNLHP